MSREFLRRASLVLNVVLTVTVVSLALNGRGSRFAPSTVDVSTERKTDGANASKVEEPSAFNKRTNSLRYADIKSASDRRQWVIDQLRAMGVTEDALALVARVDFEVEWDSRFEACRWDRDKLAAVQLEMDMARDAEMRAALGESGFKQWDQKNMLWEAMSTEVDVSEAEAAGIYDLKKKLQRRLLDIEQARLKGTLDDAEISDAYDKAYSGYNQQLKVLLGDDRYAKSQQLDDAFSADVLRHELANANPSDSQFRELFKAQQEWTKGQSELDPSSPDYTAQFKALNETRDQEYRQVLGADVFDTLQKHHDPVYSQMKKYESLWELDDNKIDYIYGTMKQYEKGVEDYQTKIAALQAQGQTVDWNTVNNQLQQLAGRTAQTLQDHLGEDSFNKLQRNHVLRFTGVRSPQ